MIVIGILLVLLRGILYRSCVVFFFKQKTAYEMRISDWSSDVCSSDLAARGQVYPWRHQRRRLTDAWRAVLALHATAPSRASMKNVITSAATYWCKVGVTFIFLDLSRDRYFMLERSAATQIGRAHV